MGLLLVSLKQSSPSFNATAPIPAGQAHPSAPTLQISALRIGTQLPSDRPAVDVKVQATTVSALVSAFS